MTPHGESKVRAFNVICVLALSLSATLRAQNPVNLPEQVGPTMTADPFTVHEKFEYRFLQTVGLHGYLGAAAGSAIGQARDVPHEWGEGLGGYASRYASDFGTNVARQSIEFGLETAL